VSEASLGERGGDPPARTHGTPMVKDHRRKLQTRKLSVESTLKAVLRRGRGSLERESFKKASTVLAEERRSCGSCVAGRRGARCLWTRRSVYLRAQDRPRRRDGWSSTQRDSIYQIGGG
jgi:hypothetical protein